MDFNWTNMNISGMLPDMPQVVSGLFPQPGFGGQVQTLSVFRWILVVDNWTLDIFSLYLFVSFVVKIMLRYIELLLCA